MSLAGAPGSLRSLSITAFNPEAEDPTELIEVGSWEEWHIIGACSARRT